MADLKTLDPRELIKESYNIEGITLSQCRTIFMDWALGGDLSTATDHIGQLLAHYGPLHPDHPMTAVLREGVDGTQGKADGKRRTGRRPRS
ncbi:MAG: hypothetical protein JXQ85_05755 [Cognatishimia sp.]|uniref:hypothetical protein n=1 Tax=Cognatishimia sp. TaxID=2211648 RepID=UPI003B8B47D4